MCPDQGRLEPLTCLCSLFPRTDPRQKTKMLHWFLSTCEGQQRTFRNMFKRLFFLPLDRGVLTLRPRGPSGPMSPGGPARPWERTGRCFCERHFGPHKGIVESTLENGTSHTNRNIPYGAFCYWINLVLIKYLLVISTHGNIMFIITQVIVAEESVGKWGIFHQHVLLKMKITRDGDLKIRFTCSPRIPRFPMGPSTPWSMIHWVS